MRGATGPRATGRRRRRHEAARFLGAAAGLAILAALLVPLALPNREGIPRAVAGSHRGNTTAPTSAPRPTPARRHGSAPRLAQATVTIGPNPSTVPVPDSYFGISTEYGAIRLFERNTPVFERMLALLHVRGDGPLVLRIGGDSADGSFWQPQWKRIPDWAFALNHVFLSRLRGLVERDRVKLIVDLNLVTEDTPLGAAEWARAAETSLPKGSIVGFEVGNEPDLYSRRHWVETIARSPLQTLTLPLELTPDMYVQDFAAYAHVLGENAPDIPLIGPAVAHPRISLAFITALIEDQRSELGSVSAHLYPYSACTKSPRSGDFPSVMRLLSPQAVSAFNTDIVDAVTLAHASGLKFRLTEFNSITCGGKAGVSNTFATALWAPDALFTAMRAGADGANLHVRASAINAPFAISRGGLSARPLLYGLLLFNRTLGPQARLIRLHLTAPGSLDLSAWAVQVRGRILHVLLIDKGRRTVDVHLHLPTSAPASVQRLLAPSPYSRSGVTLNGQQLNYAAQWIGTQRSETVSAGARGYSLVVPRRSAALLSVAIGAPSKAHRHVLSEHHRRVAVSQHAVLAVRLNRSRKH